MFETVTVRNISCRKAPYLTYGIKDARVQAPLTNNMMTETRTIQTEVFSSLGPPPSRIHARGCAPELKLSAQSTHA